MTCCTPAVRVTIILSYTQHQDDRRCSILIVYLACISYGRTPKSPRVYLTLTLTGPTINSKTRNSLLEADGRDDYLQVPWCNVFTKRWSGRWGRVCGSKNECDRNLPSPLLSVRSIRHHLLPGAVPSKSCSGECPAPFE